MPGSAGSKYGIIDDELPLGENARKSVINKLCKLNEQKGETTMSSELYDHEEETGDNGENEDDSSSDNGSNDEPNED